MKNFPKPCGFCGQIFKGRKEQVFCGTKCSQKHVAIVRAPSRKKQIQERVRGLKCAECHSVVGMSGAASGRLLNMDKSAICIFRQTNGLKTTASLEARKAALEAAQRVVAERNNALPCRWQEDQWGGVVDSYWTGNNAMRFTLGENARCSEAMVHYWLNVDASRKRSRIGAMRRWRDGNNKEIRVKAMLRNHISRVCRKSKTGKTRKTIEYLGATVGFVKAHLQRQFKKGMTWGNHGSFWEVDHIIPMSNFNLHDLNDRMRVNHYTNLRPMIKSENRKKGARMDVSAHQPILL